MNLLWFALGVLATFFVAWNNGSNNAPNTIGTAVGAGVLGVKKALLIAAIAAFAGAISLGVYVTDTVMKGIVNTIELPGPIVVKGMISVLIATGIWTLVSTFLKVPMSVHVCVLGGVVGFGLAVGSSFISWETISRILMAWIIVPFVTAGIAYTLYPLFSRSFREPRLAKTSLITSSYITAATPVILILVKTVSVSSIVLALMITITISTIATALVYMYWRERVAKGGMPLHEASRILLVMVAIAMAFSFGSNDVANSAGPFAAILYALGFGDVSMDIWLAIIVATLGLSTGIIMWGSKIIDTIGEKISPLTPPTAFIAQLSAALTMLVVSRLGLPVSTSMAIVGGVVGVGLSRGTRSINARLVTRIFTLWLVSLPVTMGISYYLTNTLIHTTP